ncbi:hypothetical protein [Roseofilum casamattae]|uniref:Uncharacterized protein n=1 Tax=Roseofilum casamattae BLCC-M143 TaxID=3022442 RepID=A0ABT7C1C9_9CYAN|nr:hypothetical protein [Roseofilum casamattae]MDJ1185105.1 hypothetical protein [Roseofilum casamattae BLCC-M143]
MTAKNINFIALKSETQRAIANYLIDVGGKGYDVQEFDRHLKYGGTKLSLAKQDGYYGKLNLATLKKLGYAVIEILHENGENKALNCFQSYRELFANQSQDRHCDSISYIQKIQILPPDLFTNIDPADLISPNGLRIPEHLNTAEEIQNYSAQLLVPKLLLAAICAIHNQFPWMDLDMDLNSTMHTMRPDPDKHHVNAGYGGGSIKQHTDGYWNEQRNVPLIIVFLSISNPNREPTGFIPVEAIFRIPSLNSPIYSDWLSVFQDLIPDGQTPEEFVKWVVEQATKPQFSFVMGVLGGDAKRAVYETPLLEKDPRYGRYLFRAKSTFGCSNPQAQSVVAFTNRMIEFLGDRQMSDSYIEVSLSPGEVYLALNGAGLSIHTNPEYEEDGYAYPVKGAATIHGRGTLSAIQGKIDRTLARGNSLLAPERTFYSPDDGAELLLEELQKDYPPSSFLSLDRNSFFPERGVVSELLNAGIRGNELKR